MSQSERRKEQTNGLTERPGQKGTAMMNKDEIMQYAAECGEESAANLLLLIGPDCFDGSFDEYEGMERMFQEGAIHE